MTRRRSGPCRRARQSLMRLGRHRVEVQNRSLQRRRSRSDLPCGSFLYHTYIVGRIYIIEWRCNSGTATPMRNRFDQAQCVLQWLMASLYSCLWTYFKCSFIGRDTLGEREVSSLQQSWLSHSPKPLSRGPILPAEAGISMFFVPFSKKARDSTASLGAPLSGVASFAGRGAHRLPSRAN